MGGSEGMNPQQESVMDEAMGVLEKEIERLKVVRDKLFGKLDPIRVQDCPVQEEQGDCKDGMQCSSIVSTIRRYSSWIEDVSCSMSKCCSELDL